MIVGLAANGLSALMMLSSCGDDSSINPLTDGGVDVALDAHAETDGGTEAEAAAPCPTHGVPHPSLAPLRLSSARFIARDDRVVFVARGSGSCPLGRPWSIGRVTAVPAADGPQAAPGGTYSQVCVRVGYPNAQFPPAIALSPEMHRVGVATVLGDFTYTTGDTVSTDDPAWATNGNADDLAGAASPDAGEDAPASTTEGAVFVGGALLVVGKAPFSDVGQIDRFVPAAVPIDGGTLEFSAKRELRAKNFESIAPIPSGGAWAVGVSAGDRAIVAKVTSAGAIDASFADAGVVELGPSGVKAAVGQLDGAGRLVVAYTTEDWTGPVIPQEERGKPSVVRIDAAGSIDSTYGSAGVAAVPLISPHKNFFSIAVEPDGATLIGGLIPAPDAALPKEAGLVRLDPNGKLDLAFGGGSTGIVRAPLRPGRTAGEALNPSGVLLSAPLPTPNCSPEFFALFAQDPGPKDPAVPTYLFQ